MNPNINLTHLLNFIQIVEWGNISKAAAMMNIAQPALSRQIKSLEGEFGAPLLRRHPWGVEPTSAGRLVLEHARRIQREYVIAKESVLDEQENPSGSVYFGVPSAYAIPIVPPLLQRMRARYPKIEIRIVEAFSHTIYEWLVTGRLDLAILYYSPEHDATDSIPYIDEEMVALGGPRVFDNKGAVGMAELARDRLIVPWRPSIHRLAIESAFLSANHAFEPAIEIDSMPCIKELAHRGEGITIFPPSSVVREIETGRLTKAHVDPKIRITAKIGRSQRRAPPRAVRIVTRELQQLAIDLAPETGWNVATGPETGVWEG